MIRRGDIYIVDLSKIFPEGKHYQRGRRPCVIVSNNMANKYNEKKKKSFFDIFRRKKKKE